MATQSNHTFTLHALSTGLVTTSYPLYGILVTEKSFLLGMRSFALEHQGHYLAHRIIGDRLPAELCDEIGAELVKLLKRDAARLFKKTADDPTARVLKFMFGPGTANCTGSELVGRSKYELLSRCETADGEVWTDASLTVVDRVGAAEGEEQRYVHVSAALIRPSIAMLVPNVAKHSGGPSLSLAGGSIFVDNHPDSDTGPSWEKIGIAWRSRQTGVAKRLVQFDHVEASIRAWNQALVERLVDGMGLRAVDVNGVEGTGGGMKPELRMLQELEWN